MKTETKETFTQGEWRAHKTEFQNGEYIIRGNNNNTLVARVKPQDVTEQELAANARLIAESKNLYSIAKRAAFLFGNVDHYPPGTIGYKLAQDATETINRISGEKIKD